MKPIKPAGSVFLIASVLLWLMALLASIAAISMIGAVIAGLIAWML